MVLTPSCLRLGAEFVEPVSEPMLLLSLLQDGHALVNALDAKGAIDTAMKCLGDNCFTMQFASSRIVLYIAFTSIESKPNTKLL